MTVQPGTHDTGLRPRNGQREGRAANPPRSPAIAKTLRRTGWTSPTVPRHRPSRNPYRRLSELDRLFFRRDAGSPADRRCGRRGRGSLALVWKFEGSATPRFCRNRPRRFTEAALSVEIIAGSGSLDAIPKVATGAFPDGFADINLLIKFPDQNPGAPVTVVMMIHSKPAFAATGPRSPGVETPARLAGNILGAPPPAAARRGPPPPMGPGRGSRSSRPRTGSTWKRSPWSPSASRPASRYWPRAALR